MPNQELTEVSAVEQLELQAIKDRMELHRSFAQLRSQVHATQERFRPANYLRAHRIQTALLAVLVGTVSGYGFAGMFTRH